MHVFVIGKALVGLVFVKVVIKCIGMYNNNKQILNGIWCVRAYNIGVCMHVCVCMYVFIFKS